MDSSAVVAGPQHLQALDQANRVRLARAALKRRVAAGDVEVSVVIEDSPWEAESMKICDLLMSQRRWGRTRCRKLLLQLGISENKPVGDLTERQRSALITLLGARTSANLPDPTMIAYRDRRLAAV